MISSLHSSRLRVSANAEVHVVFLVESCAQTGSRWQPALRCTGAAYWKPAPRCFYQVSQHCERDPLQSQAAEKLVPVSLTQGEPRGERERESERERRL